MTYLILNRTPLARFRFQDWLGPDNEAVLLTDAAAVSTDPAERAGQLAGYAHVEVIDDFHFNPSVETLALALHERWGFDQVVAVSEFELLRAARLRELFALPGQNMHSANAFRDKLAMKDILSEADVPLATYASVSNCADLLRFIDRVGYPVVVKPRRGGGSMDVHVLHGMADVELLVDTHRDLGTDDGAHLLVEEYIEHELLHVDGLIVNGEVKFMWPSTQGDSTCLDIKLGQALHSSMLDECDPLFGPTRTLTNQALAALPTPETFMFHAEIFLTINGTLVFNEVASRAGGGMIEDVIELGFGIFLPEAYVRFISGNEPPEIEPAPSQIAGLALFPPRAGTLVSIPENCPLPDITEYRKYAEPGTELIAAKMSTERIGSVLAAGRSRADVEATLAHAHTWFDEVAVIRESEARALGSA